MPGTQNSEANPLDATPVLVEEAENVDHGIPVPRSLKVIGKVVYWKEGPNFSEAAAHLNSGSDVKPGQFVGVWHGFRSQALITVLQVANCREVNPNEEPELAVARDRLGLGTRYAKEGVSTRIFRLLEGSTIEELEVTLSDAGFTVRGEPRAAEVLVRAGDPLILLNSELIAQTIGSQADPDAGLDMGTVYGDTPVPVVFKPEMLQMHTGIFGNPGKGKSYSSGVLMEEALKWQIPTLVLDVNGEMIEAARSMGGLVLTLPDRNSFGLSLALLTSPELIQIAPTSRRARYTQNSSSSRTNASRRRRRAPVSPSLICKPRWWKWPRCRT